MKTTEILDLYDATIAKGGSTDHVIVATVKAAIKHARQECADIVLNRRVAVNWNEREALAKMILELTD